MNNKTKTEYMLVAGNTAVELVDNLNQLAADTPDTAQWEVVSVTCNGGAYHEAVMKRPYNPDRGMITESSL